MQRACDLLPFFYYRTEITKEYESAGGKVIDDTLPRRRKRGEKRKISEMGTRDMLEFELNRRESKKQNLKKRNL